MIYVHSVIKIKNAFNTLFLLNNPLPSNTIITLSIHTKAAGKAFSRVPGVGIAAWKLHKSPEQIHNLYKTENTYTTDIVAATVIPIAAGNAGVSTGTSDIRFLLRYFIPQYDEKSANTKEIQPCSL